MLSLHPMTPESFRRFLQRSVATYAAENVRSGRWSAEEAQEHSAAEFQTLLPEGSATPDNFCFDLHDVDRDQDVGVLWYKLMQRGGQQIAFVYEIEVGAEHRRRGYAREAFRLLEHHAAERGATAVQLHIFGHNHPARALYEGLGFEPVSITMQRELKPLH